MKLGAQDLRLLKAFVGGDTSTPRSSPKFTVTKNQLDGNWMGGSNLARWQHGTILLGETYGLSSQSVHRKLKSLAKSIWGPNTQKVQDEPVVTLGHLKPKRRAGKKATWANMLGPITGKL